MSDSPRLILLVEDNEDDVFIFTRAFRQARLAYPLHVARDGQEALDYLTGAGRFVDREKFPLPFLMLLDLKLPFRHGLEVLETVRADRDLATLPVVVLTSSAEQRDIARAQLLKAHAYLVKPPSAVMVSSAVAAVVARLAAEPDAAPARIPGDLLDDSALSAREG